MFNVRVASIVLFILSAATTSFAQQKCCTCKAKDGHEFQVAQAGGCKIACEASGGEYYAVKPCVYGAPPPGSYPVPDTHCDPYWNEIGGSCKGNHWIECGLTIQQVTPTAKAGQPMQVDFTSQNLGQEVGPRNTGLRHRI